MIHSDDIYNIYKNIQQEKYQRDKNQYESVKIWLKELKEEKHFDTFIGDDFYSNFTFGFLSPWQKKILLESDSWCLDATHNTTNIARGLLYSIVVRHPLSGTGCPVAFLFTQNQSSFPLSRFFSFLRFIIGVSSPKKITIDVSDVELDALSRVFPETQVQWCCFHVARAWLSKLKQYVNVGNTLDNARIRKRMMHALEEMMWERRKPEFTVKLSQFIQDPEFVKITEFMEYFKQYYLDNDAFMMWNAAYQPQMYTNMETNNCIESWHNQLRTMYLKRKRNRRVDRLVYILVNGVEQDYIHNIQRISNNIGRKGPEERRRRRKLVTHAINEEIIPEMITARFNDTNNITAVQVRLFSSSDISYEVTVNDGILNACSCQGFIFYKIPCKYIHLVKRLYSQFNILHPANSQSLLHQQNTNNIIYNYADDSDLFDSFKLIINSFEEKKGLLTEEQLNYIKQHCNDMKNLLSKVNEEQIPANNNLATQRQIK